MKNLFKHSLASSLIGVATVGPALAGNSADPIIEVPAAGEASNWEFRLQPYGWLTGLEGSTGVNPIVADIDQSFGDILDNIEMAAALQFEARHRRWGIIADGFYADLGATGNARDLFYDEVEFEMKQFIGELSLAYRVYESPDAFVDVYGGMRYNSLSMDLSATLSLPGIQVVSETTSERVLSGVSERAAAIVQPKVAAYTAATAAKRSAIEAQIASAIEAEADGRVKRDLEKQLVRIRRDGGLDARDIASNRIVRAVKSERLALARSTAQLKVAELRAGVDASQQARVVRAQTRVSRAEKQLASAIIQQLTNRLPTRASADKDWVDPIIGARAQWNIDDRWFLAGKGDVGGFGVESDFTWNLQASVGYKFNESVSLEVGYRYFDTDFSDGRFTYDIAESGALIGLNFNF